MDPTRAACAGEFAPQHRAEVKANEVVERAASEVGFDQRRIDVSWVGHRLGHGGFGDCVECDAFDVGGFLDRAALGQRFFKVPRDRFALAIGVRGEDDCVIGFERIGNRRDMFAGVVRDLPFHLEIIVRIDRSVFRRKVTHVAVRCQNRIVRAEVLVDRFRFGRRFDNNYGHEILTFSDNNGAVCSARPGGATCGVSSRIVNQDWWVPSNFCTDTPV